MSTNCIKYSKTTIAAIATIALALPISYIHLNIQDINMYYIYAASILVIIALYKHASRNRNKIEADIISEFFTILTVLSIIDGHRHEDEKILMSEITKYHPIDLDGIVSEIDRISDNQKQLEITADSALNSECFNTLRSCNEFNQLKYKLIEIFNIMIKADKELYTCEINLTKKLCDRLEIDFTTVEHIIKDI